MSLISLDEPGLRSTDETASHLGGAPELVALHDPTPRLDLVPRHILQQMLPETREARRRRLGRGAAATVAIHLGFAAAFAVLLTWRPVPATHEVEVPVEVVVEQPPAKPVSKAEAAKPEAPRPDAPAPEPPKPPPSKSLADLIPQAPAPAPDPHPPAPPGVQPPPQGQPLPSPLLAPPPEPTRAETQTRTTDKANAEPEKAEPPKATHEAKPLDAPKVLSTTNQAASLSVPAAAKPPQPQPPAPAPEAPKAPNETEKLAAVLPTDTSGLPASFRAVLSGNGAAVDAAYKGLVYGRFSHAAEIGERARRQHLKGQVIVAFTIGDDGGLKSLAVLQSSGSAAVDALGLEMIRSAAPFPPPPPGAQHSFTPALAFGE